MALVAFLVVAMVVAIAFVMRSGDEDEAASGEITLGPSEVLLEPKDTLGPDPFEDASDVTQSGPASVPTTMPTVGYWGTSSGDPRPHDSRCDHGGTDQHQFTLAGGDPVARRVESGALRRHPQQPELRQGTNEGVPGDQSDQGAGLGRRPEHRPDAALGWWYQPHHR